MILGCIFRFCDSVMLYAEVAHEGIHKPFDEEGSIE